jgi:PASTA domain-containing protein/IPT/TIG domain-containing protein
MPPVSCTFSEPSDEIQLGAATAPRYFVAAPGVITSWSTFAGTGPTQSFSFKVFRKIAPFTYLVVAQDVEALTPGVLNTFQVEVPVQPLDFIGESQPGGGAPTPCVFSTGLAQDAILFKEGGNVPPGGTVVFPGVLESGFRLNVSATVLPPPKVAAISPRQGSVKGATVTITGGNFASVRAVTFGSAAAKRFSVVSEEEIRAVSPASTTFSKVPVTVTTVSGTATSTQTFAYEGCKVPQLRGKKLEAAKRRLRKADCRLGKVKKLDGATAKTGKVTKQNPKPGKVLAPGSKVKITLDA